jgi:hypothetical protein
MVNKKEPDPFFPVLVSLSRAGSDNVPKMKMRALSRLDELKELLAITEHCAAQALMAKQQAQKYAHYYRVNAEEFRRQAARSRFPEIQARLLRIAASSERLCNLAEGKGDVTESEGRAEPGEPAKSLHEATKRAEDPVSQARRHVAEAEARIERQEALVARLSDNSKLVALANEAREILATLKQTLRLARDHLALELMK